MLLPSSSGYVYIYDVFIYVYAHSQLLFFLTFFLVTCTAGFSQADFLTGENTPLFFFFFVVVVVLVFKRLRHPST